MSMISKGIAAFKAQKPNTSGPIPPAATPATYTTADFAPKGVAHLDSQGPDNPATEAAKQFKAPEDK